MPQAGNARPADRYTAAREQMVRRQLAERDIEDARVLEAFRKVRRHLFVPPQYHDEAYADHPIHIGHGQTISQPYMVALMTEALTLSGDEKVLEIGTGSGYQTAILAELARIVYTVERIGELADAAREVLRSLGYANIEFTVGDGTLGLPEGAPYDAILVAAAAPAVPKSLVAQLAVGGRLVIPVGAHYSQMLTVVEKSESDCSTREVCPCVFVKLIGREGYDET